MENIKYVVKKSFKSHCVCRKIYNPGEVWSVNKVISKKRAYIDVNGALHKVKLSRALTNSEPLGD